MPAQGTSRSSAPAAASERYGPADPVPAVPAQPRDDIIRTLENSGHVILRDLLFRSGSTALGEGRIASLDALAAYLADNPSRQILFVGHTDATGSLEANRRVSLRRAEAAMSYLRDRHRSALRVWDTWPRSRRTSRPKGARRTAGSRRC